MNARRRQNDAFPIFGRGAIKRLKAVKTHSERGILCQKRKRARSLLNANEEPAYRSATQQSPAIGIF